MSNLNNRKTKKIGDAKMKKNLKEPKKNLELSQNIVNEIKM